MKQRLSLSELHGQAAPVLKDFVKVQAKYCGEIPIDSLIYAMVRHLALTIAVSCDNDQERREWIGTLMDKFLNEFSRRQENP